MITITVNGKTEQTEKKTIEMFLQEKKVDRETTIVEYNRNILPREELGSIHLEENDVLELIRFVGGG